MVDYHEPVNELSEDHRNIVRALSSFKEELEAVNWYFQRAMVTKDLELNKIIFHNMKEEIEHAVMSLEWLRRNMSEWDNILKKYLFTTESIVSLEEDDKSKKNKIYKGLPIT